MGCRSYSRQCGDHMIETGVSYFANAWLHPFARDLEDIRAHNCSYIVNCFSENEMIFARQRIAHFFKSTRDVGLGCWANPWAVMGLFGGELIVDFLRDVGIRVEFGTLGKTGKEIIKVDINPEGLLFFDRNSELRLDLA